jgi:hypothetical protein
MQLTFQVDTKGAIRGGYSKSGQVTLDVNPANLSQEDRELLAAYVDYRDHVRVTANLVTADAPTVEGLIAGVKREAAAEQKRIADRKAKEDAELAEAEAHDRESLAQKRLVCITDYGSYQTYRPDSYRLNYASEKRSGELVTRRSPEWAAWEAEVEAANRKAKEDDKARCAAIEAEREAKQKAGIDRLKVWVAAHGSELTKARLEEGFPGWVSAAKNDTEDAIAEVVFGSKLVEPSCDPPGHCSSEERRSPTLPEINALREVRKLLQASPFADRTSVSLIWTTYRDEESGEKTGVPEVRVTVTHLDGDEETLDFRVVD